MTGIEPNANPKKMVTRFVPDYNEHRKAMFRSTPFSPIRPSQARGDDGLPGITTSLKFGEVLDAQNLARYRQNSRNGFVDAQFDRNAKLTALYLQAPGLTVRLKTESYPTSKAILVRDNYNNRQLHVAFKEEMHGEFLSHIPGLSSEYWGKYFQPVFEVDVSVMFISTREMGLGNLKTQGAVKFLKMERIANGGVNFPQQMHNPFHDLKPVAFDLEAEITYFRS